MQSRVESTDVKKGLSSQILDGSVPSQLAAADLFTPQGFWCTSGLKPFIGLINY